MITSFSSFTYAVPLLNQQFNWKHTLHSYFILWSHTLVINMSRSHEYLKTLSDLFILHPRALSRTGKYLFSLLFVEFTWQYFFNQVGIIIILDMQISSNHGSAWYNKNLGHAYSSFLSLTIYERVSSMGEVFEPWCPRTGRRFYSTSLMGTWNCIYFWCQAFCNHLVVMLSLPEINSCT